MNKNPVLFFVVKTCSGVLTVKRGHYLGLPTCENPEGKPIPERARRAIDSGAIIRELGRHELLHSFRGQWGNEMRDIEIHLFPQAVIIELITTLWTQPDTNDPRIDCIMRTALEVLMPVEQATVKVA